MAVTSALAMSSFSAIAAACSPKRKAKCALAATASKCAAKSKCAPKCAPKCAAKCDPKK